MLYDLDMIKFMVYKGCCKGGGGTLIVQEGGVFKSDSTEVLKVLSRTMAKCTQNMQLLP